MAKMAARRVTVAGDGEEAMVGDNGVAVVGNGVAYSDPNKPERITYKGQAIAGIGGAAVCGDLATAKATKNSMAFAGEGGWADVGDGSVAFAANEGHATACWNSVAYVDDNAWAVSNRQGVAIARAGLAQTLVNGVAGAWVKRGIAIAGENGMAIAFQEGAIVQAGEGGVLAGFWTDGKDVVRLAVERIDKQCGLQPDTLYRFHGGEFLALTDAEKASAERDIVDWKKRWI